MSALQIEAEALAQVVAQVNGKPVTRGQLRDAFDLVADKTNWKMPIDAVVDLRISYPSEAREHINLIREAVIFFAGCVPTFEPIKWSRPKRSYKVRVRAVGYYTAIGA